MWRAKGKVVVMIGYRELRFNLDRKEKVNLTDIREKPDRTMA